MCGSVGMPTTAMAMPSSQVASATGGGSVTQVPVQQTADWTVYAPPTSPMPIQDALAGSATGTATMPAMPAPSGSGAPAGKDAKHGHIMIPRDKPVNQAKARKNLKATMEFFGNIKRTNKGLSFRPGSTMTHAKVGKELRKKFKKQYPNLPVPTHVMFSGKGKVPLGVMYASRDGDFDLGMGRKHQHFAGGAQMQHMWFTPEDLDLAFADTPGVSPIVRAHRELDFQPSERVLAAMAAGRTTVISDEDMAAMHSGGMDMGAATAASAAGHAH